MAEITNLTGMMTNCINLNNPKTTDVENLIDRFCNPYDSGKRMYINPKERSIILKALIDLHKSL